MVIISSANYKNNFILNISFIIKDGNNIVRKQKTINLKSYIDNKNKDGIFAPLKNIEYFKDFRLNSNTIEWKNGADIAPERLLELS